MKHGDFTGLAADYAAYRPGYSTVVRAGLLGLLERPATSLDAVDIGAGTGIWTRLLDQAHFRTVTAIEPNDDMRRAGEADPRAPRITWRTGSGEATGLGDQTADFVSMASSFHWVDFARGTAEFRRLLRPRGWFCALWNPRRLDRSRLLTEVEEKLNSLRPDIVRVSSGRSGVTEGLTDRLRDEGGFAEVVYLEGQHAEIRNKAAYIGAWRSVNDIRVQLGAEKFQYFLDWLDERLADIDEIETLYTTRAWAARV